MNLPALLELCEESIRCHADDSVSSKEWSRARAKFRQACSEEVVACLVRVAMAAQNMDQRTIFATNDDCGWSVRDSLHALDAALIGESHD